MKLTQEIIDMLSPTFNADNDQVWGTDGLFCEPFLPEHAKPLADLLNQVKSSLPAPIGSIPEEFKDGRKVMLYAHEKIRENGIDHIQEDKPYQFIGYWGTGGFIIATDRWIAVNHGEHDNKAIGHAVYAFSEI